MPVVPDFSKPYRVDNGKKFRLKDFDPADTSQVKSKKDAEKELPRGRRAHDRFAGQALRAGQVGDYC